MKKIGSKHSGSVSRKKEIIKAALECFIESGITNASINEICRKSNSSTGSIYHHFGSKEQLAAAVYLEGITDYQEGYIKVLESSMDAKEGIYGVITYHLEWVVKNPGWALFIVRDRHASFMETKESELGRLNQEFIRRVSMWFYKHIVSGTIRKTSPELYQAILMGPVQEYIKNFMLNNQTQDIKKVAEDLGFSAWVALKT